MVKQKIYCPHCRSLTDQVENMDKWGFQEKLENLSSLTGTVANIIDISCFVCTECYGVNYEIENSFEITDD